MPMLFHGDRKVQSAIIPIIIGRAEAAVEAARVLADRGFFVPAIRYPTVARDAARLRVTISSRHTTKQISALCEQLRGFVS
jgi:7-keto-8-aminopelargonate synthetase-like enzyme